MSTILRFKRGTTTELATLTESLGEIVVDTSKKTLAVMDGSTAGGTPLATEAYVTNAISGLSTGGGTDSQTLSLSGNTLSISGGNSIDLSSIAGSANTDSQTLSLSGNTLSISGGNSIDLSIFNNSTAGLASTTYVDTSISTALSSYSTTAQMNQAIQDASFSGGGGVTSLGGLTDVDLATATPTSGQALVYDGANWVPGDMTGGAADLSQYFNRTSGSTQFVSADVVYQTESNVTFQRAVNLTVDSVNNVTQGRLQFTGALPGTLKTDEAGAPIDGSNNGAQLDLAFWRYGKLADGTVDVTTKTQTAWIGTPNYGDGDFTISANWFEQKSVEDTNRKGTGVFQHRQADGRTMIGGRQAQLFVGTAWNGDNTTPGVNNNDSAFVFYNGDSSQGTQYIDAQGCVYRGDASGLFNIPASGINNTTVKRFGETATYTEYSAEQKYNNTRTTFAGKIEGKNRNNGGEIDGLNTIRYMLLDSDFNGLTFSNMFYNDLGYGRLSGRVSNFTVTSTTGTVSFDDAAIDRLFDAGNSYVGIQSSTAFTNATDEVVLSFDISPGLRWEGIIGAQFGAYAPTYCKIEAYNNKDDGAGSPIGWEIVAEDGEGVGSGRKIGNITNYVMGRVDTDGSGLTSIRMTLRKDPAISTNDIRIASIFGLEYNTNAGKTLYVDRSGGNIYGDLNVNGNLTINGSTVTAGAGGGGGAVTINDLTDVDTFTAAPTDGQALVWDNANAKWIPGTVAGGGSVDLTNYLNVNQSTTINADQTMNGTLIMNGALIGPSDKTRKSQIAKMILQSSAEAGMTYSPNFINDWAYAYRRGLIDVTVTDRDGLITAQPTTGQIDALFDAKFSYYGINKDVFASGNQVTIELQLRDVALGSYGGELGIQFSSGGGGFGPDYCKIEVYKEDQSAWVTLAEDSNMAYGNFLVGGFTQDGTSNGFQNISGVRYTFSKNSSLANVSYNDIRINTLWCVDSSTALGTSLFAAADSPSISGRTILENGNLFIRAHQNGALNADGTTVQGDIHGNTDDASVTFQVYGKDATTGITDTTSTTTRGFIGLKNYTDDFFIEGPRNTNADGTDNFGSQTLLRAYTGSNDMGLYAAGTEQLRISNGVVEAKNGAVFTGDGSGLTNLPSGATTLAELSDVDTTATAGQVLTSDGAGNYTFTTMSGGGGGGASLSKATTTVTANGQTGTLVVTAYGDLSDLSATSSANGDIITISTAAEIQSIKWLQMPGFNTTASVSFVFPDPDGAVDAVLMRFPCFDTYNIQGALQTVIGHTTSAAAGTTTIVKTGLGSGSGYQFSIRY